MVTTLHLERGEYAEVSATADGGLLVELTEAGERRLVEQCARRAAALEERADQRAVWLRSLSTDELVALATSRLGGPDPELVAEAARRAREAAERMAPALEALRSLGLLGADQ
jgi:hypothetical protein